MIKLFLSSVRMIQRLSLPVWSLISRMKKYLSLMKRRLQLLVSVSCCILLQCKQQYSFVLFNINTSLLIFFQVQNFPYPQLRRHTLCHQHRIMSLHYQLAIKLKEQINTKRKIYIKLFDLYLIFVISSLDIWFVTKLQIVTHLSCL